MTYRFFTQSVAVVLFASLALGIAAASGAPAAESSAARPGIPSTRGVYAACYNKASGAMRLVKTSSGCRAFERKVQLASQRPARARRAAWLAGPGWY